MQADLSRNYFELFGLPVGFDVDGETLASRYRNLQRTVHPDRFAGAPEPERRLSAQLAARVNEGFRILKSPLARARYLLDLGGVPSDDGDRSVEPAFLMEQMEWREALDAARRSTDPSAEIAGIRAEIEGKEHLLVEGLRALFAQSSGPGLERARREVRKMQFLERLLAEVEALEEEMSGASPSAN